MKVPGHDSPPAPASSPYRLCVLLTVVTTLSIQAASSAPGLIGIVYRDSAMTRPQASVILTQLDNRQANWPQAGDWSLRLRGFLTAPVSGRVAFRIKTAQSARLFLRGENVVDVTNGESLAEVETVAGQPVPILLEFAQESPPSDFSVAWRLPGRTFEPVPASALSHDHSDREVVEAAGVKPEQEMLLEVHNPSPDRLPSLHVWRRNEELLVGATFPNLPEFTCDSWCYESAMEFITCRDVGDGRLELQHRLTAAPDVLVVTTVTPEPGAVEFSARLERVDGGDGPFPTLPVVPNLCWQLKRAPDFASRPDPYPEFVDRCFIFTANGRTFLGDTERRPIPVQPADDPRNNPPWVQMYGPDWEPPARARPDGWADYSPDRFTCTIVGAVSRDRRFLAAIATGTASALCQAWHDCMHITSSWKPPDKPSAQRTWRMKIYVMENDPDRLLERAATDFPEMREQPIFEREHAVTPSRR